MGGCSSETGGCGSEMGGWVGVFKKEFKSPTFNPNPLPNTPTHPPTHPFLISLLFVASLSMGRERWESQVSAACHVIMPKKRDTMDDIVVSTVANAAFALTLNGSAGLSPFLCMLLLGIASRASPDDLPLGDTMAEVLGSIPALGFWAVMTILEYVGKCVPVLDQVVDSIEVFVVPVLSALGSLAAFGSFDHGDGSAEDNGGNNDGGDERRRGRRLGATSGVAVFFRVVLVLFGSMLALSMHFFKVRPAG
ncbi:hypothetical protein THAOC_15997 [Thalassiosira oceanica]|uniref:DUF4126 domain-containing protein n=1 Tax=Thalassiosira oceanica TaxID=159749 RepID=K0SYP4_THAOC|nr:hypothetical protein THAOC_15997 [Thalassiosira oceanica]|eukprot:EJK63347.1 hypothetical protein THAOC_15997 [Thalassiosira oceanica]